jgi:hypothetical protein
VTSGLFIGCKRDQSNVCGKVFWLDVGENVRSPAFASTDREKSKVLSAMIKQATASVAQAHHQE